MRISCALLVLLSLVALGAPAQADWLDNFDDGLVSDDWEFSVPPIYGSSTTWSVDASQGYLVVTDDKSHDDGGVRGVRGLNTSEMFSNVRVSGTINVDPSIGTFFGLTAMDTGQSAYLFSISTAPTDAQGSVVLARAGVQDFQQWNSFDDYGIPTLLDVSRSYFMELDVVGGQLTGRVFDTAGGTELIKVSQTIANPIAGPGLAGVFSGVNVGFGHVPMGGTYDDLSAIAIPEPKMTALLWIASAGMVWVRLRSRLDSIVQSHT